MSYDNLFIETGESIFEDLRGNSLLTFAEQAGEQRVNRCRRGPARRGAGAEPETTS